MLATDLPPVGSLNHLPLELGLTVAQEYQGCTSSTVHVMHDMFKDVTKPFYRPNCGCVRLGTLHVRY